MKETMEKNNILSVDDLMQLPEIDGLVQEVKGLQTVKTEGKEIQTGNDQWRLFLQHLGSYGYLVRKAGRKGYWIDDDIAETLKSCDIDHKSVADIHQCHSQDFYRTEQGTFARMYQKKE
jgi:hypothetical protein